LGLFVRGSSPASDVILANPTKDPPTPVEMGKIHDWGVPLQEVKITFNQVLVPEIFKTSGVV
jgi:hypothetical protein